MHWIRNYTGAVSYTHLDVYKRQVPRYYENLSVLHENTMPARAYYIPASKRMDNLVAVSYTHLDVYKRQHVHATDNRDRINYRIFHIPVRSLFI